MDFQVTYISISAIEGSIVVTSTWWERSIVGYPRLGLLIQHIEVYTSPKSSSISHASVVGLDFFKVTGAKIEYDFFNNHFLLERQADPFLSLST